LLLQKLDAPLEALGGDVAQETVGAVSIRYRVLRQAGFTQLETQVAGIGDGDRIGCRFRNVGK